MESLVNTLVGRASGLGQDEKRGRQSRGECEARCGAVAAGAVREQQGASQADLAPGVPGDLQRQQMTGVDVVVCCGKVEAAQRRWQGPGTASSRWSTGAGSASKNRPSRRGRAPAHREHRGRRLVAADPSQDDSWSRQNAA